MKTREQIYQKEGAALLRLVTTYHTLLYEQIIQFFPKKEESIRTMITILSKQGRIYFDKQAGLVCDSKQSAEDPDHGMIAAFWVLLDFKDEIVYHCCGEFPSKLCFFARDEEYSIVYAAPGKESLISHVLSGHLPNETQLIILLDSEQQAGKLDVPHAIVFCTVSPDGTVHYYRKEESE